jgi:hypothetical protein
MPVRRRCRTCHRLYRTVASPERSQYARVSDCGGCRMTVLALLIAVLAVLIVGTMLLLSAHWFTVQIAKSLERLIEVDF